MAVPPPPPGFTLDAGFVPPPPGFTLDDPSPQRAKPASAKVAPPPPPAGFKLDEAPGVLARVNAGLNAAVAPISERIAETTAPLRKGAEEMPALPSTAPSRAVTSKPSEDLDQQALFEQRAKLKPGTPEYNDLTRKIAK